MSRSTGLLLAVTIVASFLRSTDCFNGHIRGNTRTSLRNQPNYFTSKFAPNNLVEQDGETILSRQNRAVGSLTSKDNEIVSNIPNDEDGSIERMESVDDGDFDDPESISSVAAFIAKAGDSQYLTYSTTYEDLLIIYFKGLVGLFTGLSVALFKSSLALTSSLFYERIADLLPKPSFYWPLGLYPIMGACIVSLITYFRGNHYFIQILLTHSLTLLLAGNSVRNGIDSIAQSIDAPSTPPSMNSIEGYSGKNNQNSGPYVFDPVNQLFRLLAAVATLGSGCSLGPEGSAVEIGASFSRIIDGVSPKEKHHLFLAGTAAGVAAGFNAPISGYLLSELNHLFIRSLTPRLIRCVLCNRMR